MLISSPSSKRCLTASFALLLAALPALASHPSAESIRSSILTDLKHRSSTSFNGLLNGWEKRFGTQAVTALMQIAREQKTNDPGRYIAIMGVAKIGGREAAPLLVPLLKDRSWMIRNGAIRALTALAHPQASDSIVPLTRDPALVVRMEAIQSLEKLHPRGSSDALVSVLEDPSNYNHGRALWVPQRALEALQHLQSQHVLAASDAKLVANKLKAYLESPRDPALKTQITGTLRIFP